MNKKYRKAIIAGNWKMNKLPSESRAFVEELKPLLPRSKKKVCEVILCMPYPFIPIAQRGSKEKRLALGAQDVSAHDSGAFTGEVSAAMLKDIGCKYCIVGHSERRQYHGETDSEVNTKVHKLLEAGISPIICVGESLEQREKELTLDFVAYQVKAAIAGLGPKEIKRCVIAYEPIWAIGTGKTATADQAAEVCNGIRAVIRSMYDARVARSVSILYGGSMNPSNCAELLSKPDIDGGLIGGASLKVADLAFMINATADGAAGEDEGEAE